MTDTRLKHCLGCAADGAAIHPSGRDTFAAYCPHCGMRGPHRESEEAAGKAWDGLGANPSVEEAVEELPSGWLRREIDDAAETMAGVEHVLHGTPSRYREALEEMLPVIEHAKSAEAMQENYYSRYRDAALKCEESARRALEDKE